MCRIWYCTSGGSSSGFAPLAPIAGDFPPRDHLATVHIAMHWMLICPFLNGLHTKGFVHLQNTCSYIFLVHGAHNLCFNTFVSVIVCRMQAMCATRDLPHRIKSFAVQASIFYTHPKLRLKHNNNSCCHILSIMCHYFYKPDRSVSFPQSYYSKESWKRSDFLLLVVKPMSSYNSTLTWSACQCLRILFLLVSDRTDHYHMPNSVVLTRK